MRYWWVNQNQTFKHEVLGGYLWSPKTKANGSINAFYEFMREVSPGDLIFSYCDTYIRAIGVAKSNAYEAPKPLEFGAVGAYWNLIGWRVEVSFTELTTQMRPMEHMPRIRPYLPKKYSPLQLNGRGQQSAYLAELPRLLAEVLIDLIGSEGRGIALNWKAADYSFETPNLGQMLWEEHQLEQVRKDQGLPETEKEALVLSRRGQGIFRRIGRELMPDY
jgi:putative restriction endonuclease